MNGNELIEDENVFDLKDKDKDEGSSTSVPIVDQFSFPPGSSSSTPIMENRNGYDQLVSVLFLEKQNAALPMTLDSSMFPVEEGSLESRSLNCPNIDNSLSAPLNRMDSDELLQFLQESSSSIPTPNHEIPRKGQSDLSSVAYQPGSGSASAMADEPSASIGVRVRRRNYRCKGLRTENKEVRADKGEGSTLNNNQERNAKERVRRMKLHDFYLALGALLPDSTRSKKRKSSRLIIDRAVEYIPELEEEIEKLNLRKNDILSKIKNKQPLNRNPNSQHADSSVSVHEIGQDEVVIQICLQRPADNAFSNLLHNAEEEEGFCIMSASTLQVSDNGVCYHLHIQMNESADGGGKHLARLREKLQA